MDVLHGDCLDILPTLPRASFHACVTDPPYHLIQGGLHLRTMTRNGDGTDRTSQANYKAGGFMNQQWDGGDVAFRAETWRAVFDVLRPGAFLVAFGGTRTAHRMTCAIEDAGFEIRDTLCWLYGSGFPKSLDVSKAIDKAAGAEREVVGSKFGLPGYRTGATGNNEVYGDGLANGGAKCDITAPATPEAAQWSGWGTALKPAYEPIILARKPLDGTVAANTLRHGCGGLNIDASRIGTDGGGQNGTNGDRDRTLYRHGAMPRSDVPIGRWPANCVHDGSPEVEAAFAQFGERTTGDLKYHDGSIEISNWRANEGRSDTKIRSAYARNGDTGTAARFFYSAKATKHDRAGSSHPTIKPIALMQWLVRLVCPPGGHIIDPFAGSGTTGEAAARLGFDCTLIEREAAHIADIHHRLGRWHGADTPLFAEAAD